MDDPKRRVGATLWLLAMCGVLALSFTVIPQLAANSPRRVPLGLAVGASIVQSGVLVLLAVWAGIACSRPLRLGAPAIEAVLAGSSAWPALRRQLPPAVFAGVVVGVMLLAAGRIAPAELGGLGSKLMIPLAAKLLYGGVTEEVLMRWGVMTVLAWLGWRFVQKKSGAPRASVMTGAIVVAALLFGLLHLPAVVAMGASLSATVVVHIVAANALPGVLFGGLYWRYGIEAAIAAHALAHLVAQVCGPLVNK